MNVLQFILGPHIFNDAGKTITFAYNVMVHN